MGFSFPIKEGFGFMKDVNGLFIQTTNGTCIYPDDVTLPFFPTDQKLSDTLDITLNVKQRSKMLAFYSDYFPSSFFPLMTDMNPYGASNSV